VHTSALRPLPDSRSPTLPPQIRFTRLGRIRSPFYRIIAIDSRKRRDGAPLEVRAAPARDGKAPHFALSRGTLLGRIKTWNAAELELSRRGTRRSPRSPSLLFTNRSLDGTTLSKSSRT